MGGNEYEGRVEGGCGSRFRGWASWIWNGAVGGAEVETGLSADSRGADVVGGVRMAITNRSCTGGGTHWFAIAYTIKPAATTHDAGAASGS